MRAQLQDHLKASEIKSSAQMLQLATADAKKVNDLLAAKATPDEAADYKNWVLDIAEEVAKSAKEGGFLGFGGTLVSGAEITLFKDLSTALGINRSIA